MPPTVFSRDPHGAAATYALIIGVGLYPALPDGGGPQFAQHEGMGQLESPPVSARAFARWLIENYRSPRPLASVQLLVGESPAQDFIYSDGPVETRVPAQPADFDTVKRAIRAWQKLSTNPNDLMIFYFCGHGISDGNEEVALLTSSFATDPQAPMDGALDFRGFRIGMEDCIARQQCFFVDACRVGSTLMKRNDSYAGDPVLHASNSANPDGRARVGPVFFSTLAGAPAFGRAGLPSVFTEALLEALSGTGADDEEGDWTVRTGRLQSAMEFLVNESIRENGWDVSQQLIADAMQDVALNTLVEPVVRVFVSVDPQAAHAQSTLRCEDIAGTRQETAPVPAPTPWTVRLPVGKYHFHADFAGAPFASVSLRDESVRPPFRRKILKAVAP